MSKILIRIPAVFILIIGFLLSTIIAANARCTIQIDGKPDVEWNKAACNYFISADSPSRTNIDSAYVNWIVDSHSNCVYLMFSVSDKSATQSNNFGAAIYINNKKTLVIKNKQSPYCLSGYGVDYAFNVLDYGCGYMLEIKINFSALPDNLTLGVVLTDAYGQDTPIKYTSMIKTETTTAKVTTTKAPKVTTTKKPKVTTTKTPKATTTKKYKVTTTKSPKVTTTRATPSSVTAVNPTTDLKTSSYTVSPNGGTLQPSTNFQEQLQQESHSQYHGEEVLYETHLGELAEENAVAVGANAEKIEEADIADFNDTSSPKNHSAKRIVATVLALLMVSAAIVIVVFINKANKNKTETE